MRYKWYPRRSPHSPFLCDSKQATLFCSCCCNVPYIRCNPGTMRQVMMTSSNGNILRVTGHLCGEFTGHRWIPRTKASDAELWCFLWSASLNKRVSKQSWGWWFETLSHPLWRHCNVNHTSNDINQCLHNRDIHFDIVVIFSARLFQYYVWGGGY